MRDQKSNYQNIVKTTSILGGAQVLQILVSIVRGKLVAILLGTSGMGINALLSSTMTLMAQLTGMGLDFSGVREISKAREFDSRRLYRIFMSYKHWSYLSILFGFVLIILLSPLLSYFSFANLNYVWAFIFLSVALVFSRLQQMNATLIQGMRQFSNLAKAALAGSLLATLLVIPLYYYWGVNGIVPGIICSFFALWISYRYFARNIHIGTNYPVSYKASIYEGFPIIKMGLASLTTSLFPTLSLYGINTFVSHFGSLSDVGLYAAGTSITTQYVGVIFTAMSTEYYPRLSTVCHDVDKMNKAVNQQAEIVTLIVAPLMVIMMLTAPFIITLLLSDEFYQIRDFIIFLAYGTFFRAASYTVGFISFAKGDKKFFVVWEGVINSLFVLSYNIIGYLLGGITGMAIAFLLGYLTYFIVITIVAGRKYGFNFESNYWYLFTKLLILCSIMLFTALVLKGSYLYITGTFICLTTLYYAYKEFDKRLDVKSILLRYIKKR